MCSNQTSKKNSESRIYMIRHDFVLNIIINQNPIIVINKFFLAIELESAQVGDYFDLCYQSSIALLAKEKSIIQLGQEPKIYIIKILEQIFSLNITYRSKPVIAWLTFITLYPHYLHYYYEIDQNLDVSSYQIVAHNVNRSIYLHYLLISC